jgi:AraC-like DNA-binding protein
VLGGRIARNAEVPPAGALQRVLYPDCAICIYNANKATDPTVAGQHRVFAFDPKLLSSFLVLDVFDPDELGDDSRVSRRFPNYNKQNSYRLRNRGVGQPQPDGMLSRLAVRREGELTIGYVASRFGTEVGIVGEGVPRVCLTFVLNGGMDMPEGPNGSATAHGTQGLVYGGRPGIRLLTTDNNARLTIWIDESRLLRALSAQLDAMAREPLTFSPAADWHSGPAAPIARMASHLVGELAHPDGLLAVPPARETFTDTLTHLILARLPHNYTERLNAPRAAAVPRHIRRAEEFIEAHADQPIAIADIAASAGCGIRTLQTAFQHFRATTPLAALHEARLRAARAALQAASDDEPTHLVAQRFGFTNPSRFNAVYTRRFGEHPRQTRSRR